MQSVPRARNPRTMVRCARAPRFAFANLLKCRVEKLFRNGDDDGDLIIAVLSIKNTQIMQCCFVVVVGQ